MKNLLTVAIAITLVATVSGCAPTDRLVVNDDGSLGPTKTFEVLQVIDDTHALALTCETRWADYCLGDLALLVVPNDTLLYDKKRVTLEKPIVRSTYTYTTIKNRQKTVPVVEQSPN